MKATNKRLVSILLVLAMVLAVLPMAAFAAGTTTLYCAAPSSWTACYVYYWGNADGAPTWPGNLMTQGADGIWYADVPSDAANVIFNNGSGTQSADLTMPTDENVQFNYVAGTWSTYGTEVEEPEIEMVTVYVEAPASWGTPNAYFWGSAVENSAAWPGNAMTYVDGNVYSAVVPSDITGLIFNGTGGQTPDLTVPTDDNVMYSVATSSWGELVINEPVEVTYTYVVAGSDTLCGTAWDTTNTANAMTVDGDVASITYTNVAEGSYEFKVVMVGTDGSTVWYGTGVDGQDNVAFTVSTACDVVITFNTVDGTVAVAGDGLGSEEPPAPVVYDYYVAGDGALVGVEWDPAANQMTQNADGLYEITFTNVAVGSYQFKVTTGSWETPSYGAATASGNYELTVYAECDVTITFNAETTEISVEATNDGLVAPPVEYDYYVAGVAGLCGVEWDPAANAMTETADGIWTITFENIAAGSYEYKITTGSWETPSYGYGEGNYTVVTEAWLSNVTITFNEETTEVNASVEVVVQDEPGAADVKWQLNGDASAEAASVDLRLITWVDSLDYSNVTFTVTIDGEVAEMACETVYTAINAEGTLIENASEVFGEDAQYFVTYTIAGLTAEHYDCEISVSVSWEALDGTVTTSETRTIVVSDDWA